MSALAITDFGNSAGLYCINVDPFDAGANPFRPGQIVWRAPIGAASLAKVQRPNELERYFVQFDVAEVFESGYQEVEQENGRTTGVKAIS